MRSEMRRPLFVLLCALLASGCGPKTVRSPDWILGQPIRYPSSFYIIGVGSAPTRAGISEALKAASASARIEIAQTIETQIDHVEEWVVESSSTREYRPGKPGWALEVEQSSLNSFTRTSTDQIIQGIELKEKYRDEERQTLYVLAVLDKVETGQRLVKEVGKLGEQVSLLRAQAQKIEAEGDLLTAVRLLRQALNFSLKADVLKRQLSVIQPQSLRDYSAAHTSARIAARLTELLLEFEFYVAVDEAGLIEDAIHEALAGTDFNVRMKAAADSTGLTLWGRVDTRWDKYPALSGAGEAELQVCRTYLGLKIVDNRTGRIVGQANLRANSNASDRERARERALMLLSQQILEELPGEVYKALSIETETGGLP